MGPGNFSVELDELDAVVRDLEACERDLGHLAVDLDREVSCVHGTWDGLAATAHAAAHREWSHGLADMHRALSALRSAAQLAHDLYSAAATANVRMWAEVSS